MAKYISPPSMFFFAHTQVLPFYAACILQNYTCILLIPWWHENVLEKLKCNFVAFFNSISFSVAFLYVTQCTMSKKEKRTHPMNHNEWCVDSRSIPWEWDRWMRRKRAKTFFCTIPSGLDLAEAKEGDKFWGPEERTCEMRSGREWSPFRE